MLKLPRFPPSLRVLRFDLGVEEPFKISNPWIWRTSEDVTLPLLEGLDISSSKYLTPEVLLRLMQPLHGRLTTFRIRQCIEIDGSCIKGLLRGGFLTNVTQFSLGELIDLNDDVFELIAATVLRLESLITTGAAITGVGVKALVERHADTLRFLRLDDCAAIGEDAIEYARAKGVEVRRRNRSGGGRSARRN
jgi:hypothetical protein